jgi:ribosomal protein L37AE/L43A
MKASMVENKRKPVWSPRVPKYKIRKLYTQDAIGIHDSELADEVGFALMARCESFLEANQAVQGEVVCPQCGAVIHHGVIKGSWLNCMSCGWSLLWDEYFETIQGKQLSGAKPVIKLFQEYLAHFPTAKSYQRKMLLIDQLIHGYHWHQKFGATRPVAVNLIDGNLANVIEFLDELHQGENHSSKLKEHHDKWVENSQSVRRWVKNED